MAKQKKPSPSKAADLLDEEEDLDNLISSTTNRRSNKIQLPKEDLNKPSEMNRSNEQVADSLDASDELSVAKQRKSRSKNTEVVDQLAKIFKTVDDQDWYKETTTIAFPKEVVSMLHSLKSYHGMSTKDIVASITLHWLKDNQEEVDKVTALLVKKVKREY
jgi:RNA binding exosome subunit